MNFSESIPFIKSCRDVSQTPHTWLPELFTRLCRGVTVLHGGTTDVTGSQNKHSWLDFFRGDIFFKAESSCINPAYACLLFQSVDAEYTHVMLAADGSRRKVASEVINMIND